ncbi:MAG: hypothetical protein J6J86_09260 [Lachnospiraceae bacterium]|nr:hypothetical protein [Lachnospiraceae bacterium]
MILPSKWGQGQLFAFSALDGSSYFSDDFTGMLSGDRIGIRFYSNVKRELAFVNVFGKGLTFDAVTSDYICCHFPQQENMRIIYAAQHLIVGNVAEPVLPAVFTEGAHLTETVDGIEIHDTQDGDFTALKCTDGRFAFAFGHSKEDVCALVNKGLSLDLDTVAADKLDFYKRHGAPDNFPYADLYAKCLSVMKTQLYSPEADFDTIWSTPDRLPHKSLWLWDSVFHALGHRHIDGSMAENLIRSIWVHQSENGFIPHRANVFETSDIIQPPVIGWGAWQLYQTSGNKDFLREAYAHNKLFLSWCQSNRRSSERELYTWSTTNDMNCRCDECGMDNSPRFDTKDPLFAIDFSCFMANDIKYMKRIAEELGLAEEAAFYQNWFNILAADTNAQLWSEEDGFYFDYNIAKQELHKVWSVTSFLPLFAGICSESQAKCLVKHLQDPESFATPFPIPTISKKDATFGSDMWRGPVWINYNYMLAQGLAEYGYGDFAGEIVDKTIAFMNYWYQLTGTINEFYDSNHQKAPSQLNRKGLPFEPYNINVRLQTIRDYGWSTTLLCDLLHQKFE